MTLDALIFGEVIVDFLPETPGLPLHEVDRFVRHRGGAPAHVAVGLARLGAKVGIITLVGADDFGLFLRAALEREGVDTTGVGTHRTARTGVTFVSIGARGERSFLFYRHPSADQLVAPHDVDPVLCARARLFHYGSSTLAREPARAATRAALAAARAAGAVISCDPNLRPHLWSDPTEAAALLCENLAATDIVKISDDELAPIGRHVVSGRRRPRDPRARPGAGHCHARRARLLLRRGRARALGLVRGVHAADAVDTTGAPGTGFWPASTRPSCPPTAPARAPARSPATWSRRLAWPAIRSRRGW